MKIIHEINLKENCIRLAVHHKKYCVGSHCDISLITLLILLRKANIKLSVEEMEYFT